MIRNLFRTIVAGIFKVLDSISSIDKAFNWMVAKLGAITGSFDNLHGSIAKLFKGLTRPIYRIGFKLADKFSRFRFPWQRKLDKESVRVDEEAILQRQLKQKDLKASVVRSALQSPVGRGLWYLFYPLIAISRFAWEFMSTRRWLVSSLWLAPLIVIVIPVMFITWRNVISRPHDIQKTYQNALEDALIAKDYQLAGMYAQKLEQLQTRRDRAGLTSAMTLASQGRTWETYQLLQSIADPDQPGDAAAHYWSARLILTDPKVRQQLELTNDELTELAEKHLAILNRSAVNRNLVLYLEGLVMYHRGHFQQALDQLKPINRTMIDAAALSMNLNNLLSRRSDAEQNAVDVHRLLNEAKEKQELDSLQYFWLAQACELLAKESEFDQIAIEWIEKFPDDQIAKDANVRRCLKEFDRQIPQLTEDAIASTVEIMVQAAAIVSESGRDLIRQRISSVARRRQQNAVYENWFQQLAARELPGYLYEHLGVLEMFAENWEQAKPLLEKATTMTPDSFSAWNSRAFLLSKIDPDQLDEALTCADRAVELNPLAPEARDVRGFIQLKLKQWEKAVEDLEIALNGTQNPQAIHAALAEAYQQLGNEPLAVAHKRLAK